MCLRKQPYPLCNLFPQSVFVRRAPGHFLEHAAQVMRVLEADFIGYFAHCFVRACQQILDTVDDSEVDVLNGRFACFLFDEVSEIVGREVKLAGTPGYSGQADLFRLV